MPQPPPPFPQHFASSLHTTTILQPPSRQPAPPPPSTSPPPCTPPTPYSLLLVGLHHHRPTPRLLPASHPQPAPPFLHPTSSLPAYTTSPFTCLLTALLHHRLLLFASSLHHRPYSLPPPCQPAHLQPPCSSLPPCRPAVCHPTDLHTTVPSDLLFTAGLHLSHLLTTDASRLFIQQLPAFAALETMSTSMIDHRSRSRQTPTSKTKAN